MIVGTGIDFVTISRMAHWIDDPPLCQRYFHPKEFEQALSRGSGASRSLAARFAAKEAFVKALGTGFKGIQLKDIWVENEGSGRPRLFVTGTAQNAMDSSGATHIHVSLGHEGDFALAQVILEGREHG